jgi:hypothetical protein
MELVGGRTDYDIPIICSFCAFLVKKVRIFRCSVAIESLFIKIGLCLLWLYNVN